MSTTSMAIFSNPLFATYSVYACNASIVITISPLRSCSCQYCYYRIKQKYCSFFSPKAFYDSQKLPKRRLRLGLRLEELTTLYQTLVGWVGGHPILNPHPWMLSASPSFQWTHFVSVLCIWSCMTEIITSANVVFCRCAYLPIWTV